MMLLPLLPRFTTCGSVADNRHNEASNRTSSRYRGPQYSAPIPFIQDNWQVLENIEAGESFGRSEEAFELLEALDARWQR